MTEGINDFDILVTQGIDTCDVIDSLGGETSWLHILPQTDRIEELFEKASCFVSASVHETFSNAIAEAVYYGLPVIQSDIPCTAWNLPSETTTYFQSGNFNDLARAMKQRINANSTDLSQDLRQASEDIKLYHSIDGWANTICEYYEANGLL